MYFDLAEEKQKLSGSGETIPMPLREKLIDRLQILLDGGDSDYISDFSGRTREQASADLIAGIFTIRELWNEPDRVFENLDVIVDKMSKIPDSDGMEKSELLGQAVEEILKDCGFASSRIQFEGLPDNEFFALLKDKIYFFDQHFTGQNLASQDRQAFQPRQPVEEAFLRLHPPVVHVLQFAVICTELAKNKGLFQAERAGDKRWYNGADLYAVMGILGRSSRSEWGGGYNQTTASLWASLFDRVDPYSAVFYKSGSQTATKVVEVEARFSNPFYWTIILLLYEVHFGPLAAGFKSADGFDAANRDYLVDYELTSRRFDQPKKVANFGECYTWPKGVDTICKVEPTGHSWLALESAKLNKMFGPLARFAKKEHEWAVLDLASDDLREMLPYIQSNSILQFVEHKQSKVKFVRYNLSPASRRTKNSRKRVYISVTKGATKGKDVWYVSFRAIRNEDGSFQVSLSQEDPSSSEPCIKMQVSSP